MVKEKMKKEHGREELSLICCGCGDTIRSGGVGSLKQPYCKKCFQEKWGGNWAAYDRWLKATHG